MYIEDDANSKGSMRLVVELTSPIKGKYNERNNYSECAPIMHNIVYDDAIRGDGEDLS